MASSVQRRSNAVLVLVAWKAGILQLFWTHERGKDRDRGQGVLGCWCSVQLLSHVWHFATPWTAARQASLSSPAPGVCSNSCPPSRVMPSNHLILYRPLLFPPSIFPSLRVFSNELVFCIRWPKYWSFSFSISPSTEYSGLISFKTDLLDLLAVQGTLKRLLQHRSSKHQFFSGQLSL